MSAVSVELRSMASGERLSVDCQLSLPDTVLVEFEISGAGRYQLSVELFGGHVAGRPFRLRLPVQAGAKQPLGPANHLHRPIAVHAAPHKLSIMPPSTPLNVLAPTFQPLRLVSPAPSGVSQASAGPRPFVEEPASDGEEEAPVGTEQWEPPEEGLAQRPPVDLVALAAQSRSGRPELFGELKLELGEWGRTEDRTEHLLTPTAVAVNERNGDIVVCDSGHKLVKIYSRRGDLWGVIGNEEQGENWPFHDPSAVAFLSRSGEPRVDLFAVKCVSALKLVAYNSDPDVDVVPDIHSSIDAVPGRPMRNLYGLAETAEGHLVTLNEAQTGGPRTEVLVLRPSDGELLSRFPLLPVGRRRPGPASKPRFIAVYGDRLLVSDLGRQRVYIVSLLQEGAEIMEFGEPGRGPGLFSFVSGLATDEEGNILVGDAKNNRVQLFDQEGGFVCVLGLGLGPGGAAGVGPKGRPGGPPPLPCPFPAGLCLGAGGHLFFASRQMASQVFVYKLFPNL